MYHELSTQDGLFVLQEADIQYFKQIVENHDRLVQQESYSKKNFWEVVLNTFFIFESEKKNYILDTDKLMLYSSNIHYLNLIVSNHSIHRFLTVSPKSPHIKFVLAYHLGVRMQLLVHELLEESEEGKVIKGKHQEGAYYRMHLDQAVKKDCTHPFYKEQKVIVSALTESNLTERFQNEVENSLQATRDYLRENLNKAWSMPIYK